MSKKRPIVLDAKDYPLLIKGYYESVFKKSTEEKALIKQAKKDYKKNNHAIR